MKLFNLNRITDVAGVSGTGIVAQGVEFDNGKVAVTWLGEFATVTTHDNIDSVKAIHCHNGLTEIQWLYSDKQNIDREYLGRLVRNIWVNFAKEQQEKTGNPAKPSNLLGWDELDEDNKEVDLRIGTILYNTGYNQGFKDNGY